MAVSVKTRPSVRSRLHRTWRLPLWVYRWGLGCFVGEHLLLLSVDGNAEGEQHRVLLDVIGKEPDGSAYYAVSTHEESAPWYQTLLANPQATIVVGRRRYRARAVRLPFEDALGWLRGVAWEQPLAFHDFVKMACLPEDDGEAGLEAAARRLLVFKFEVLS